MSSPMRGDQAVQAYHVGGDGWKYLDSSPEDDRRRKAGQLRQHRVHGTLQPQLPGRPNLCGKPAQSCEPSPPSDFPELSRTFQKATGYGDPEAWI